MPTEEKKKTRFVVASVLKPINDTRMRRKIARSLLRVHDSEVHVIGYPSADLHDGIVSHPLPTFARLSLKRLSIPVRMLAGVFSLRPDVLIVTTHELLWVACVARFIFRCKVIYDVQENYFRNILCTDAFPRILRPLLAAFVRTMEVITSPFLHHFFLAEAAYASELTFPAKRYTILENKAVGISPHARTRNRKRLIFTGTIAESTGVFNAITIADQLHEIDREFNLTIVGYCHRKTTLQKLHEAVEKRNFVTLIGGGQIVPHDEIVEQIQQAGAGIIAYPPNRSTWSAVPTKLYEYLAARLPIILIRNPRWVELCDQYSACVVFDQESPDAAGVHQRLVTGSFYTREPQDVLWEAEEKNLLGIVHQLISSKR